MSQRVRRYSHKRRISVFLTVFFICFAVLIAQLFRWQIVEAESLQRKALGQWTSTTVVSAARGAIYDRNGELLAVSGLSKSLVAKPSIVAKSGKINELADILADILQCDRESVYSKLSKTNYAEVTVKRHLSQTETESD